jgi:hypothetical protein
MSVALLWLQAFRRDLQGWWPTTWRRPLWQAAAVGAGTLFATGTPMRHAGDMALFIPWLYHAVQFGLPLVLALRWADHRVRQGTPSWLAHGLAVVVSVGAGTWVIGHALWPVLGKQPWWGPTDDLWLALTVGLFAALGVSVYAQANERRRVQARLEAGLQAAAVEQQQLALARLLALQARVEPAVLFEALVRVQRRLPHDSAAAQAQLTDLIALLRALQPAPTRSGLPAQASSLARELSLVRAYARVAALAHWQPPQLTVFEPEPALRAARLVPMLLLPVLRKLLVQAEGTAGEGGHSASDRWQLQARARPDPSGHGRWVLLVWNAGPGGERALAQAARDRDFWADLQQRLSAVHGPTAALRWVRAPTPALEIEMPLELLAEDQHTEHEHDLPHR